METVLLIVVTLLGGGLLGQLISYRKVKAEINTLKSQATLNDANEKKVIVSMALELTEEVRQFYEIRMSLLEQRVVDLEKKNVALELELQELRKGR